MGLGPACPFDRNACVVCFSYMYIAKSLKNLEKIYQKTHLNESLSYASFI